MTRAERNEKIQKKMEEQLKRIADSLEQLNRIIKSIIDHDTDYSYNGAPANALKIRLEEDAEVRVYGGIDTYKS